MRKASGKNRSIAGNKAAALANIMVHGLRVPYGLCITRRAYDSFIRETGIGQKILLELGRKRFEDMRWEEMWDASLRIRNMFTN
ncbi:MAG: PEP/pyruvate-binding domain-containing protein [bacterium]